MKKIKLLLALVFGLGIGVFGLMPQNTYAACDSNHFMNLPAWYDGLPGDTDAATGACSVKTPDNEKEMKKYIWTVALNITSIIFGVAGYLAVLFVIYGGFLYMLSRGDPGQAAKGKKTITNAIIGIVICALASTIAGAINEVVVAARDSGDFFVSIANTAIMWAGIVSVIMIVVGGIYYTSSNGEANKIVQAKNSIMFAIIGLVITIVAAAIVNTVLGAL